MSEQPAGYLTLPQAQRRVENGKPRCKPSDARTAIRRAISRRAVAALMLVEDEWLVCDPEQFAHTDVDFASSRLKLAGGALGEPAAPPPIRVIGDWLLAEDVPAPAPAALAPVPPSAYAEPPPNIEEPVYPAEVLAQGLTIAQREATEAHYQRRKREYDEATTAWRTREEERRAARAAWERRHPTTPTPWPAPATPSFASGNFLTEEEARRAEDRMRETMERAAGIVPEEFADRAPAAKDRHFGPLIVVAGDDIERIADPPPPQPARPIPPPAATAVETDEASPKLGRPQQYDVAAIQAEMKRLVIAEGKIPRSQNFFSQVVHQHLCTTLADPPAEITVRRWVREIWEELPELIKPSAWKGENAPQVTLDHKEL